MGKRIDLAAPLHERSAVKASIDTLLGPPANAIRNAGSTVLTFTGRILLQNEMGVFATLGGLLLNNEKTCRNRPRARMGSAFLCEGRQADKVDGRRVRNYRVRDRGRKELEAKFVLAQERHTPRLHGRRRFRGSKLAARGSSSAARTIAEKRLHTGRRWQPGRRLRPGLAQIPAQAHSKGAREQGGRALQLSVSHCEHVCAKKQKQFVFGQGAIYFRPFPPTSRKGA